MESKVLSAKTHGAHLTSVVEAYLPRIDRTPAQRGKLINIVNLTVFRWLRYQGSEGHSLASPLGNPANGIANTQARCSAAIVRPPKTRMPCFSPAQLNEIFPQNP